MTDFTSRSFAFHRLLEVFFHSVSCSIVQVEETVHVTVAPLPFRLGVGVAVAALARSSVQVFRVNSHMEREKKHLLRFIKMVGVVARPLLFGIDRVLGLYWIIVELIELLIW